MQTLALQLSDVDDSLLVSMERPFIVIIFFWIVRSSFAQRLLTYTLHHLFAVKLCSGLWTHPSFMWETSLIY